jgi:hypothetical protein
VTSTSPSSLRRAIAALARSTLRRAISGRPPVPEIGLMMTATLGALATAGD